MSQVHLGFGQVISVNGNDESFVVKLDPASRPPVETVRATMALGKYMGDTGANGPRFLPRQPNAFDISNPDGTVRTVQPKLYLPPIGEIIFVMVIDQALGAWSFKKWHDSADREVQRRIHNEKRKREQEEADQLNRLLEDFGNQDVIPQISASTASDSDTVHVTADEGIQESTIGAIAASQGTPFKAPRKGGKGNGVDIKEARPAVQA